MTLPERFWKKVTVGADAECWPWIASRNPTSGYGQISVNGRPTQAHRIALQLSGVDVPPRTPVHHICENRGCVNPAHLELLPAIGRRPRVARRLSDTRAPMCGWTRCLTARS